eukprot:gene10088-11940_t
MKSATLAVHTAVNKFEELQAKLCETLLRLVPAVVPVQIPTEKIADFSESDFGAIL